MHRLLLAFGLWLALIGAAVAQGCGPQNPNCVVPTPPPGDNSDRAANTAWVNANGGGGTPALPSANIFVGSSSNVATARALSGDCTITNTGAITCSKSS